MKRSSDDLLKCRSRILRATGLVMLPTSSMMLVQVFEEENSAQLCTISPNSEFTIVASSFEYASKQDQFLWIYVQSCSMMLPDDDSTKGNAICLKKFEEMVRENFERLGSRSEIMRS